jgi:hypothetical protein
VQKIGRKIAKKRSGIKDREIDGAGRLKIVQNADCE